MTFQPLRDGQHPITPAHLAKKLREKMDWYEKNGRLLTNPLHNSTLRNHYAEVGTAHLIFFCDERGRDWQPLTAAELEEGTKNMLLDPHNPFHTGATCASFLVDKRWLVREGETETYDKSTFFTHELITACHDALTK